MPHYCYSGVSFFVAVLLSAITASTALFRVLALFSFFLFCLKCELKLFTCQHLRPEGCVYPEAAFLILLQVLVMSLHLENWVIWNWGFGRSVKEERILTVILINVFVLKKNINMHTNNLLLIVSHHRTSYKLFFVDP